ncbi:MAG: hypothetical protein AAF740_03215, partial [Bacteroidota bacterium]
MEFAKDEDALIPITFTALTGRLKKDGTRFSSYLEEKQVGVLYQEYFKLLDENDLKILEGMSMLNNGGDKVKGQLNSMGIRRSLGGYGWYSAKVSEFGEHADTVRQYIHRIYVPIFESMTSKKLAPVKQNSSIYYHVRVSDLEDFVRVVTDVEIKFRFYEKEGNSILESDLWIEGKKRDFSQVSRLYTFGFMYAGTTFC